MKTFFRTLLSFFIFSSFAIAEADSFEVGVTLPLTGPFAEYGEAIRNGIELARTDLKEHSKWVKFIYEDDSYEPKRGIVSFEKLRSQDRVDLVFAWGIEPVRAIAIAAERAKFPTLVGSLDGAASAGRKYVVGAFSPYEAYSCDLMKEMAKKGLLKLGYIKSEVSLFTGLLDGAKNCLQPGQTLIEVNHFIPTDNDFRAAISRLSKMSFDAVGVYLTSPQLLSFFKQAVSLQYSTTFFGPTLFYDRQLVKSFPELLNGAYLTHNLASKEFSRRYVHRFQNDSHLGYAAHAHEIARMLLQRFSNKSNLLHDEVLEILLKDMSPAESVAGVYDLTAHRQGGYYFSFPPGVYRITSDAKYQLINSPTF